MGCPFCGHEMTKVVDTRMCRGDRVRKRRCAGCGGRFSTAERITVEYMRVRKRRGRLEPFSRAKLRAGLAKAALGTALAGDDVDVLVGRVLAILQPEAPDIPVPSKEIGELVLDQMRSGPAGTEVARARYAMAFFGGSGKARGSRGLTDLLDWLEHEYGSPRLSAVESAPVTVVKRDERTEPFQQAKITASVIAAAKGQEADGVVDKLAWLATSVTVEELTGQAIVTSQQIAAEVVKVLRSRDPIAYLRYATAVKRYRSVDDVWRDALAAREAR